MRRSLARAALPLLVSAATGAAWAADDVGQVTHAEGLATAQRPGEAPRFLAKGDSFGEGEVLSVSSRGYAIISFKDGAKMTLRPNTVFAVDKYAHDRGEENAVMRLLRGGLRAVTGLIGKRNPNGVQLNTPTATIGIRGTDFDARLCGPECRQEAQQAPARTAPAAPASAAGPVVARVAQIQGSASAQGADGQSRALTSGAPLYSGESVRTARNSNAVLTFRDETRVTLHPDTAFRIENFRQEADNAGSIALRLIRGGMRAITGLIGKRDPRSVQLHTAVATIGIRGTGVDLFCEGRCAGEAIDEPPPPAGQQPQARGRRPAPVPTVVLAPGRNEGLFVYTWDGGVDVKVGDRSFPVNAGEAGFVDVTRNLAQVLAQVPGFVRENPMLRPDQMPPNTQNLFGTVPAGAEDPGLYVYVRHGHVVVQTPETRIDLGDQEAARLLQGATQPQRLDAPPAALLNDPIPLPTQAAGERGRLAQLLGRPGAPGDEMCEMR